MSQKRRRENPEYYRSLGCVVPRKFVFPNKSGGLAELIGVLLGDGCITKGQVSVTLNKETDKLFIEYVVNLIQELFHYTPSVLERNHSKVKVIVISGIRMVEFLYGIGMRIGNKVRQQVDVPVWIKEDKEFVRWCVRGLVDTDGGVFEHKYKIRNKEYSYLKLHFTNKSKPLIQFVYKVLDSVGLHPKLFSDNKVWLYSETEVKRYLEIIGSSNDRLLQKLRV